MASGPSPSISPPKHRTNVIDADGRGCETVTIQACGKTRRSGRTSVFFERRNCWLAVDFERVFSNATGTTGLHPEILWMPDCPKDRTDSVFHCSSIFLLKTQLLQHPFGAYFPLEEVASPFGSASLAQVTLRRFNAEPVKGLASRKHSPFL